MAHNVYIPEANFRKSYQISEGTRKVYSIFFAIKDIPFGYKLSTGNSICCNPIESKETVQSIAESSN
jgi:hypothetical protein